MNIHSKELNKKFKIIKPFISASILDINHSVLIKDGYMYAVNKNFSVKQKIDCSYTSDEGKCEVFLIPIDTAKTICSIANVDIAFSIQDSNTIKYTCLLGSPCRKFGNTYKTDDVSLFPLDTFSLTDHKEISSFKINGSDLVNALNKVLYAINKEKFGVLRGVHIHKDSFDNGIDFVGCDGCRLTKYELPYKDTSLTLYSTFYLEVADYICKAKPTGDVKITVFDKHICFETEDFMVISRLYEENYIPYNGYFVYNPKISMIMNRKELEDSLAFSNKNVSQKYDLIIATFENGQFSLSTTLKDGSILEDEPNIISLESTDSDCTMKIGLNVKYLYEAVKYTDEDIITLSVIDPVSPVFVLPKAEVKDTNTVAQKTFILPIRLA